MKKQSNLSKLIGYAEGHKKLTVLGCILSGVAAILGLVPYVCVWLVARDALSSLPGCGICRSDGYLGLDGGLVCSGKYCGVFRRSDVHPYRGFPDGEKYPTHRRSPCDAASSGIFHRKSVRTSPQDHR